MQRALITHWHVDHVSGIPDLKRLCPQVIVHKREPEEGEEDIEDGQVFSVDGATLRASYTPGHAFDHMVFVLEEEDALITGDSRFIFIICLMLKAYTFVFDRCLGTWDECLRRPESLHIQPAEDAQSSLRPRIPRPRPSDRESSN